MVSIYSSDKPFKVYCGKCWWGDRWDSEAYGQNFDFSRPFFDQFRELMLDVPHPGAMVFNSTNCEYNSFCVDSKDCYLSSRIADGEKIFHSYLVIKSYRCMDCHNLIECHSLSNLTSTRLVDPMNWRGPPKEQSETERPQEGDQTQPQ